MLGVCMYIYYKDNVVRPNFVKSNCFIVFINISLSVNFFASQTNNKVKKKTKLKPIYQILEKGDLLF